MHEFTTLRRAAFSGYKAGWWVDYKGNHWDGPFESEDEAIQTQAKRQAALDAEDPEIMKLVKRVEKERAGQVSAGVNPKQAWGDRKLKTQWVPPSAICAMARGLGEGGEKYGPYNWRDEPVETLTYYGGCMRHLLAWFDGEDLDPDSAQGKTHLEGAISSLAILIDATVSGYAIDNRPKAGGAPRMLLEGARNEDLDPNSNAA